MNEHLAIFCDFAVGLFFYRSRGKKEEKEMGQYISIPTHLSSLKVYSKINLLIFYYSILACKKKVDSRIEGLSFA